jgi:hypothetical protein
MFFLQTTSNNYIICLRLFKAFYGYVYVKCNELWQLCHTHRFIGKCTRKGGVSWWGQHPGCHLILVVGLQLNGQRTLWSYVRKSYVQSNQHQSTPGFFPEFHAHYPRKIFYTRLVGRVVWPTADSTLPGRGDGVGVLTCLALASWSWYYATARRAQSAWHQCDLICNSAFYSALKRSLKANWLWNMKNENKQLWSRCGWKLMNISFPMVEAADMSPLIELRVNRIHKVQTKTHSWPMLAANWYDVLTAT